MPEGPIRDNSNGTAFTTADFLEAGRGPLRLEVVAGGPKALDRVIEEPFVSRPGLALTGFYEHFAWRRLQLIGKAERAYLDSLADAERLARLRALIERGAFCFIFTCDRTPRPDETQLALDTGVAVMTTPLKTRFFAHESTFVLERLGAPRTSIWGTMVEVAGLGVLFEGDAGLGKSETALGLVKRGHALVADDLTRIRREVGSELLFGSASPSTAGLMEIRGLGIIDVARIFGVAAVRGEKRLQMVVTFKRLDDVRDKVDRIGQKTLERTILGVNLPNVVIPVSEGRDLVNLVETAALKQRLSMTGADPVAELSERLKRRADAVLASHGKAV